MHLDSVTGLGLLTSAGLRVFLEVGIRYELVMCPNALRRSQAGLRDPSRIEPGCRVICPDELRRSRAGGCDPLRTRSEKISCKETEPINHEDVQNEKDIEFLNMCRYRTLELRNP